MWNIQTRSRVSDNGQRYFSIDAGIYELWCNAIKNNRQILWSVMLRLIDLYIKYFLLVCIVSELSGIGGYRLVRYPPRNVEKTHNLSYLWWLWINLQFWMSVSYWVVLSMKFNHIWSPTRSEECLIKRRA